MCELRVVETDEIYRKTHLINGIDYVKIRISKKKCLNLLIFLFKHTVLRAQGHEETSLKTVLAQFQTLQKFNFFLWAQLYTERALKR